MTRDTVNVLSIPCTGNTARGLVGNILNVLMMDQVDFSQVHYPCPYSVFTMSWVRKLVFVPSVTLRDVLWLQTTHRENLKKAPNNGEALWETILMVWRLYWLEKELEEADENFVRRWVAHLSAWLVSSLIGILARRMIDFQEVDSS